MYVLISIVRVSLCMAHVIDGYPSRWVHIPIGNNQDCGAFGDEERAWSDISYHLRSRRRVDQSLLPLQPCQPPQHHNVCKIHPPTTSVVWSHGYVNLLELTYHWWLPFSPFFFIVIVVIVVGQSLRNIMFFLLLHACEILKVKTNKQEMRLV